MFYILSAVCVIGVIACIIFKNKYYGVITAIGAVCFPLLRIYWLIISKLAPKISGGVSGILIRSQVPYIAFAVLITLFYIFECVYYALNVKQRN